MKKEKWFEDQPILKADFEREQIAREDSLTERFGDIDTFGVVSGSQQLGEASEFLITQGPNPGLFITIATGVAYSSVGERIIVPSVSAYNAAAPTTTTDNGIGGTTLTPQSTGTQNVPVTNNATNYIWIGYLETTDTSVFTLNNFSNERLFVQHNDGFEVAVTTISTNPDSSRYVLLGEVVTAAGAVTSINTSNANETMSVGPVAIPGSPYQIALSTFANLPAEADRPSSVPVIAGFAYTTGTPAASQFTVDFKTGIVTFNSADSATNVTISYSTLRTRRQYFLPKKNTVGTYITTNTAPATYSAGRPVTLTEHVNARGTGIITPTNPHGYAAADIGLAGVLDIGGKLATSGVTTTNGDVSSVSSALSPSAVSAFSLPDNKVTIAPLIAGETLNASGTLITATEIPSTTIFDFIDPNTLLPLAAGTYYFYVDKITKVVARAVGAVPGTDNFPIASIVWDGSKLLLPITDLRTFGTTAKQNLRLETILALASGAATDNRLTTIYNAKLTASVVVTPPTYAYTGLGGTTLNVTVDGTPQSVTFPALPANPTISSVVAEINSQIPTAKAVKLATNQIKLLAPVSLRITGGAAAPILGFIVYPTSGSEDSGDIKEIRIGGSTSSTGVGEEVVDAEVLFTYDIGGKLTQVVATMGNKTLTTLMTYNADDTLKTVQEIVS